jgi:hypothetical protein
MSADLHFSDEAIDRAVAFLRATRAEDVGNDDQS